jgi:hypothetical protein
MLRVHQQNPVFRHRVLIAGIEKKVHQDYHFDCIEMRSPSSVVCSSSEFSLDWMQT